MRERVNASSASGELTSPKCRSFLGQGRVILYTSESHSICMTAAVSYRPSILLAKHFQSEELFVEQLRYYKYVKSGP